MGGEAVLLLGYFFFLKTNEKKSWITCYTGGSFDLYSLDLTFL